MYQPGQQPNLFYQEKLLLSSILGVEIGQIFMQNYQISHAQETEYKKKLSLLQGGVPLDYLIGSIQFLDYKIKLNKHVLIPRPETQEWISEARQIFQNPKFRSFTLIDLACGSGVIGISLASLFSEVIFSDVSKRALGIAKENVILNEVKDSFFYQSNLLNFLLESDFDKTLLRNFILISNLPYLPIADKQNEKSQNIEFEPQIALYAGSDGLDLFKRLLKQLRVLQSMRILPELCLFELDPRNIQIAEKLTKSLYRSSKILQDFNNLQRLLWLSEPILS